MSRQVPNQGIPVFGDDDPTVLLGMMTEAEQFLFLADALANTQSPCNEQVTGGLESAFSFPMPDLEQLLSNGANALAGQYLIPTPATTAPAPMMELPDPTSFDGTSPFATATEPTEPKGKLTAKQSKDLVQTRAREAQRRFRQRQKERKAEMANQLETLTNDIEKERLQQEVLGHKHALMENILEYRDDQVSILKRGYKESLCLPDSLDEEPTPLKYVLPEHLAIMKSTSTPGAYNLERLLRYTPAGFEGHLGPDGLARTAPPFEKLIDDCSDLIRRMRMIMNIASNGLAHPEDGMDATFSELTASSNDGDGSLHSGHRASLQNLDGMVSNAQSTCSQGGMNTCNANGAAAGLDINYNNHQHSSGLGGNLATINSSDASGTIPGSGSGKQGSGAILGEDDSKVLASPDVTHPGIAHVWGKDGTQLHQLAADLIGIEHIDRGLQEYKNNGVTYSFNGQLLRRATMLLHTVGMLGWQQSILFPDNMIRLSSARLDTGAPGPSHELEDIDHWRSVLRGLDLRKDQLEQIVKHHRTFVAAVRPVHRERAALMQHLKEFTSFDGGDQRSVQAHIQESIELGECSSALNQNIRKEYTAYLALTGGIIKTLDFPVQRMLLMTLSWPYWPQSNILGTCAALELGLNPTEYELDEEVEEGQQAGDECMMERQNSSGVIPLKGAFD